MDRDKRTEQLGLADKTAIAAALQAQKEAAGAQIEMSAAANAKMETTFSKQIEQTQALLQEVRRSTDSKIDDLKSRLDKGEGKTSVSDPAVASGLIGLTEMVKSLSTSRDTLSGGAANRALVFSLISLVVTVVVGVSIVFANLNKSNGATSINPPSITERR